MSKVQSMPEIENSSLLSKLFTSKKWQKKLSNQNMNYQWIPCDQAQTQKLLTQLQINVPNSGVCSCESDYFTTTLQMKIPGSKLTDLASRMKFGTDQYFRAIVVQYKNALYLVMFSTANTTSHAGEKILQQFVQAIQTSGKPHGDINGNTEDYGSFFTLAADKNQNMNGTTTVSAPTITNTSTIDPQLTVQNDNSVIGNQQGPVTVTVTSTSLDPTATTTLNNSNGTGIYVHSCYQKIMNLPYASQSMIDRTVLSHENTDKSKPLQQINRSIFRQCYDPNITQQYMNSHWYIYYGNTIPQVIYTSKQWEEEVGGEIVIKYEDILNNGLTFSYQVMVPMNKLFWMWQQDFLPLFKLRNPLRLQIILNTSYLSKAFNVFTIDTTGTSSTKVGVLNAAPTTFIDYNDITYYNNGLYMLISQDTVMEKNLAEELNSMEGIYLPQTQTWIESYKTTTGEQKQYQTNVGFSCLDNIELGLYYTNNQAYYRSYSSLHDICKEYYVYDTANHTTTILNGQKDTYQWYLNQFSFYLPQITLNAKQTFIGQKFLNSPLLYLAINNRGQDTDDQNPFCQDIYTYYNKVNIRYSQFTDKYIQDVEDNEMNYSGVSIQKQNNNYIVCQLANYNTSDFQNSLKPLDDHTTIMKRSPTVNDDSYYVELLYKYKQILMIDNQGNLSQVLQEYML